MPLEADIARSHIKYEEMVERITKINFKNHLNEFYDLDVLNHLAVPQLVPVLLQLIRHPLLSPEDQHDLLGHLTRELSSHGQPLENLERLMTTPGWYLGIIDILMALDTKKQDTGVNNHVRMVESECISFITKALILALRWGRTLRDFDPSSNLLLDTKFNFVHLSREFQNGKRCYGALFVRETLFFICASV